MYKLYSDPGHGWLAVKRAELIKLDILSKITHCSYQSRSGKTVYLEEDCDLSTFVYAKVGKEGVRAWFDLNVTTIHKDKLASIRSLPPFQV